MKCQITHCLRAASYRIGWRSDFMDTTAVWYQCHPCTLETLVQFNHSAGRIAFCTTPLPADIIGA